MPVELIADLNDPRVAPYRDMKDRELAREGGLFVAEGEHLVRRLLDSDFPVHSLLLARRRVEEIAPLVPPDVPVYGADDALIERVIGFRFHSGVLAVGRRKPPESIDALMERLLALPGNRELLLVVCPEVINADNMGSLIRVSAAFGADAMLIGERSCDPFWRRSVRVSMGAVFRLPLLRSEDLRRDLLLMRERWGVELVATVLDPDAEPLERAVRPPRLGLLLGSESQGLQPYWLKACHRRVTIPMQHGTDSLNVAVTAAVFLYHFTRVRPREP